MQKYLVAVLLLLCGVTALHAAQAQVPAATEAPPPGQQTTVSTMNLADDCAKQANDCIAKVGAKIDSHEITTKAQADTADDACWAAAHLCLDAIPKPPEICVQQHDACLAKISAKIDSHEFTTQAQIGKAWDDCAAAMNLCIHSFPKPLAPVVQKDDCNVKPSSAQLGKVIQSVIQEGKVLPAQILQMQQMQKNAFDLEIKCEQLKAARTPCK
jgi:UDP-N-acetylmuramyl pentapeptide synthase